MPEFTLIQNSPTCASVDRGASAAAHDSLFGVVNIQAMQVQSGATELNDLTTGRI